MSTDRTIDPLITDLLAIAGEERITPPPEIANGWCPEDTRPSIEELTETLTGWGYSLWLIRHAKQRYAPQAGVWHLSLTHFSGEPCPYGWAYPDLRETLHQAVLTLEGNRQPGVSDDAFNAAEEHRQRFMRDTP